MASDQLVSFTSTRQGRISGRRSEPGEHGASRAGGAARSDSPPAGGTARRDPFTPGELPMRPTYHPEEEAGGRSEIWSILGGLAVIMLGIVVAAWLVAGLY